MPQLIISLEGLGIKSVVEDLNAEKVDFYINSLMAELK